MTNNDILKQSLRLVCLGAIVLAAGCAAAPATSDCGTGAHDDAALPGGSEPDLQNPGAPMDAAVPVGKDGGADAAVATDGAPPVTDAAGPPVLPACPSFGKPVAAGTIEHSSVLEASGIAASRRNPGVLWVHNDSGDDPNVYAITASGKAVATFVLDGANANDWEDLAIGPGPMNGVSYLYVGDIGDNVFARPDVNIYRVAEPQTGSPVMTPPLTVLKNVETFTLAYPDHAHNAETLFVDPQTGDVYIVVKDGSGTSPVFRARAPLDPKATNKMELVATLVFGKAPLSGNPETTGGHMSPSGDEIVIRTYDHAFLWRRPKGLSVGDALMMPPCPLPLANEPQGEAVGYAADGAGYYTTSEGQAATLSYYPRK